ncbi:MAG: hypothetical protein ACLFM2_07835, partial [Halothece sp.]
KISIALKIVKFSYWLFVIVIPISFRSATVSVASREQDALNTSHLMVFIWNHYIRYSLLVHCSLVYKGQS